MPLPPSGICFDAKGFWPPGRNLPLLLLGFGLVLVSARSGFGQTVPVSAIARNGTDIEVSFEAVLGNTYRLQRKIELTAMNWENIPSLSDLSAAMNGTAEITDPDAIELGRAFYRVVYVPTLLVTKSGTGAGTVTSSPAGVNCGTDCTENFVAGTDVTLTATANTGSYFSLWGGDCTGSGGCILSMDSAMSVTANFVLLNSNPSCAGGNQFLGTVSGDTSGAPLAVSNLGERWLRVRVTEDSSSVGAEDLLARVVLTPPAGTDYDLYVHCEICAGTVFSSTSTGTETIELHRDDVSGSDDSFDILIEVRYFSGGSSGNWALSVTGDVGVGGQTCPP